MNSIFIFLFLIIFPFGQIIRIGIIQPIDVVVGLAAVYTIIKKFPRPEIFKYLNHFLFFALVSWVFSIFFFKQVDVLYGLLYLIRLVGYLYFFIYVYNFVKAKKNNSKLLTDSLLALSVISAIFGWIQFFTFPDLKPFFVWGWDMHLFRLVGTFLDPTFLGLIIVFGLIISMIRFIEVKSKRLYLLIGAFLLISLAFTYSRASYLAFIAGIGYLLYTKKKIGYILYPILILGGLILILPTSKNHSIEFLRSFSALARIENYQTTIKIFQKSPIFGIGYDNMCIAYQKFVGPQPFSSHACSGSDSSLLFVLATTGVLGFIVFIYALRKVNENISGDKLLLTSSFVALLIHSTFSNSIFYSWIMGYMVILLAVEITKKN